MIAPAANTECMNLHLKEIATQVSPGARAAVVCDGAGWHQRGGKLEVPDNIVMITLPPYAPELNPMENVWHYLRENKLCAAWRQLRGDCRRLSGSLALPDQRSRPYPLHRR